MNRRRLLAQAAAIPLLPILGPEPALSAAPEFRCVRPNDPAWPSAASWEKLNQDVGGRLIKVQPLLPACAEGTASTSCPMPRSAA